MITYTVLYKNVGSFLWNKLKKVKGDGIVENSKSRFFILEDETRVEIPVENVMFKFSRDRFYSIQNRMNEDAGQKIQLKKG